MTEKTEALRLAEFYEALAEEPPKSPDNSNIRAAAAELRRLHAENEAQQGAIAQFHHAVAGAGWHPGRTDDLLTDIIRDKGQELRRLHAQRDALLEALRAIVHAATVHACHHALSVDGQQFYDIARAAIAKAEEA